MNNTKIAQKLKEYGPGFHTIYLNGREDERIENKIEYTRNFLEHGVDEKTILECIDISPEELEKIRSRITSDSPKRNSVYKSTIA